MAEEKKAPAEAAADNKPDGKARTGHLSIQKVYVKDLSYEAPNTPHIFMEEWRPTVDLQLANNTAPLGGDIHEVVLTVTVTVRFEDKVAYLIEVKQAGIFNLAGFPEQHLAPVLATVCPNILFPFAREVVSDIATKAGFPQLLLAPVNFEALYAQEVMRQRGAAAADGAAPPAATAH